MKISGQKFMYFKISFLVTIFGLLSCNSKNTDSIKIGILQGPTEISFMKMIENQPIVDGKNVEIIIKNEPQQIQALMIQKKIDFAVLPTIMAANLYNKGVKYKMLGCPVWGTLYILSNNNKIHSLPDLQGRTINVFGQGISPDILFQYLIKLKDIKNIKIDYSFTSNLDLAQALLQKRIESAIISEPLVSVLLRRDTTIKKIAQLSCENFIENTERDIFAQTAFTVNSTFLDKYPQVVKVITNQYTNSCNFINEKPEEAAELAVKLNILPDLETAKISIPLCNIRYMSAFAIEHELQHYFNIFLNYNPESIGGKIPNDDFIIRKNLNETF